MKILTFNVNGLRSAFRKGFITWLKEAKPDIICLQEIRARRSELPSDLYPLCRYHTYWNFSAKPGYSGTAILSREKPHSVQLGLGNDKLDGEGRAMIASYPEFLLINCYFPNGNQAPDRLAYKLAFYEAFLDECRTLKSSGLPLVLCGDLNTAHQELDLADPKAGQGRSGFLSVERNWITRLLDAGFIDAYRFLYPSQAGAYTWWPANPGAKDNNCGWRYDYIFVQTELRQKLRSAFMLSHVAISDHCPFGIELALQ